MKIFLTYQNLNQLLFVNIKLCTNSKKKSFSQKLTQNIKGKCI